MAWIESHQELKDHPKTKRLARALGINLPQAIGHLHCLWWWAVDYAPEGDLSRYDAGDIADAALWDGDPERFLEALVYAGFVDRDESGLRIHDWDAYAGRLIDKRRQEAQRKRDMRAAYEAGTIDAVRARDGDHCRYCGRRVNWNDRRGPAGGTYDHIDPNGPTTADNLVVCCRACNSHKGSRRPEEAGMVLLPPRGARNGTRSDLGLNQIRPNTDLPTVPNLTVPNQKTRTTTARAHACEAAPPDPPELPWQDDDEDDDGPSSLGDHGAVSWRIWYERAYAVPPPERWARPIDRLVARGMAHEVVIAAIESARNGGAGHPLSAAAARLADAWTRGVRTLDDWHRYRLAREQAAAASEQRAPPPSPAWRPLPDHLPREEAEP